MPADIGPPLRMAVSRLRQRLDRVGLPDCIVASRSAYRLAVAFDQVDSEQFSALVAEGRRVAEASVDRAAALLEAALALWRGEPFGSLSTEPWAEAPAARLLELRLGAEEELAGFDLMRGREGVIVERLRA